MKDIIVFGAGIISELAKYYFDNDSMYSVVAFTSDDKYIAKNQSTWLDLPLIPFSEILQKYHPSKYKMFVAIGYSNKNQIRYKIYNKVKDLGYELVNYISSKCTLLTNESIGDNCFILEDNTIQPFVKIGNNVTLWSGNHIGHHSIIGDHCFISSHVVVSGKCIIGEKTFLGVNSTIVDHVNIGNRNIIAAGATVIKDTHNNKTYIGSPAKER